MLFDFRNPNIPSRQFLYGRDPRERIRPEEIIWPKYDTVNRRYINLGKDTKNERRNIFKTKTGKEKVKLNFLNKVRYKKENYEPKYTLEQQKGKNINNAHIKRNKKDGKRNI